MLGGCPGWDTLTTFGWCWGKGGLGCTCCGCWLMTTCAGPAGFIGLPWHTTVCWAMLIPDELEAGMALLCTTFVCIVGFGWEDAILARFTIALAPNCPFWLVTGLATLPIELWINPLLTDVIGFGLFFTGDSGFSIPFAGISGGIVDMTLSNSR